MNYTVILTVVVVTKYSNKRILSNMNINYNYIEIFKFKTFLYIII